MQNGAKGTRISAVGPEAQREGLWPDMKLVDARAMMPDLQVEQHRLEADEMLFKQLAHWMLRYSPSVSTYEYDSFVLDITGCDHLFGGEMTMAQMIENAFLKMGFSARIAISNSVSAGFALVHYGAKPIYRLPVNWRGDELDILPVEALRLNGETVTLLKRLGLKHIGDVRRLPRVALERRFRESRKSTTKRQSASLAQSVQWRLDQLSGALAEPLVTIVEPQNFRAQKQCPELALEHGAVAIAFDEMLPDLCALLQEAGKGARCICLTGYRADGGSSAARVSLSQPANRPDILARLFKDRFDRIDCGFGIDLFVLEASGVSAISTEQHDIMGGEQVSLSSSSIANFADIVENRVGSNAVSRLAPCASHVPERAQKMVGVNAPISWDKWKRVQPRWSPRPVRLLVRPEPALVTAQVPDSPPIQFVWRRVLRRVVRSRGPERILPEWWHDNLKSRPGALYRDYYDVEDEFGRRYWLFRATKAEQMVTHDNDNADDEMRTVLTSSWFVHGLF